MKIGIVVLLASVSMVGLSSPAFAQSTDDPDAIVVTARHREGNVQNTGASIFAVSGDTLREQIVRDVTDITRQVPNFRFTSPGGAGNNPSLSIRGVGLSTFSDTVESSVAMYIDDIYIGTLGGQSANIFDVKRVEVLRGPQGTLYGRNTTAGLVSYVTEKPSDTLDGHMDVSAATRNEYRAEAAIGGPLASSLRARAAIVYDYDGGYIKNRISDVTGPNNKTLAGRLQLEADLGPDGKLLLIGHGSRFRGQQTYYKFRGYNRADGSPCSLPEIKSQQCYDDFGYRDTNTNPYSTALNSRGTYAFNIDTYGVSGRLTGKISDIDLVSITGGEWLKKEYQDPSYPSPAAFIAGRFPLKTWQFSEEVRASQSTQNIDWQLGVFYYRDGKKGAFLIPGSDVGSFSNNYDQKTESIAGYGHVEWRFASTLTARGGVRYTKENKSLQSAVVGFGPGFVFDGRYSKGSVSWDVGLDWRPATDLLGFINIARGTKSGGWNAGGFNTDVSQLTSYKPEQLTMFEAGVKSRPLPGLRVNATAFYYDYKDFQAITSTNVNGFPVARLTNAGNAKNYGGELEINLRPADFLDFSVGTAYLHTTTSDFFNVIGVDSSGASIIQDLSGNKLNNAPKWSGNAMARVTQPLAGGEVTLQGNLSYSAHYFFNPDNAPQHVGGKYVLVDFRLAWEPADKRFNVALFGKNVFNQSYIDAGFDFFGGQGLIYNRPSAFGAALTYKFGR